MGAHLHLEIALARSRDEDLHDLVLPELPQGTGRALRSGIPMPWRVDGDLNHARRAYKREEDVLRLRKLLAIPGASDREVRAWGVVVAHAISFAPFGQGCHIPSNALLYMGNSLC